MDALEEVDVGCPNKDLFHIVKGKRTKRLRLSGVPCNNNNTNNIEDGSDNEEGIACKNNNNNIEDGSGNGEGHVVACRNNYNNNIEDGKDNGEGITCKNNNNNIEDGNGNGEGIVAWKNNNNDIEDGSGNGEAVAYNNNTTNNNNDNNYSNRSSTNSAEIFINTFTDEEEETAESLILMSKLSDDHPRPPRFTLPPDNKVDFFNDNLRLYQTKFNSKRYIETSTNSANGTKAGIYVYECKTCNRTFPSFQALGGHRASHKKPKTILTTELSNKKSYFDFSDEDDYQELSPSTTTLYKNNKNVTKTLPNSSNKFSSPRIHECSYCGAEFTSGQALGGHMRRHRRGVNVYSPLHLSNLSPATSIDQEFGNNIVKKPRDGLSLDLNIPVSDDHIDPKFPVVSLNQQDQEQTQRQQLVDCHY
ncbi:uncharacterized protein LOC107769700 [Nicotiana tabacum]|uniref:GATA zinc finger domain-containing protein 15-like n=1 Tax=Nicotiana tabacum TaxID=4097 RepID=A0A1S3XWV5_TOBAC|nr:PREDICTED: GATA zinc finger domain-containing protein 15-like [Nicotiana tabacum]